MTASPTSLNHSSDLAEAFLVSREILRRHGKSYYFSTQMLPRRLRLPTYAIYAFVRCPDEVVDKWPMNTPGEIQAVKCELNNWREQWRNAYESGDSSHPVLKATAWTFREYSIPYEYSDSFIDAMVQDIDKDIYGDYAELEDYMYGSASTVGLIMSHLIGFENPALEHAKKLGYAMQLTNFLRDIDEDYQERRRVYMPQDELAKFGLSNLDIAQRNFTPQFREFAKFQAQRAHRLYDEANEGIALLEPEGRLAVATSSTLYRAILDKIKAQDYNIFAGRAATSFHEKIGLMGKAWKLSKQ